MLVKGHRSLIWCLNSILGSGSMDREWGKKLIKGIDWKFKKPGIEVLKLREFCLDANGKDDSLETTCLENWTTNHGF